MILDLPMPPSVNHMWTIGRGPARMRLSDEYKAWKKTCAALCMAGRWHKSPIKGRYVIAITLDRAQCRKGSDLGNREKAVSDFLQEMGIIENDNLAESILVEWGVAPSGCRVDVRAINTVTVYPGIIVDAADLLPPLEGETV